VLNFEYLYQCEVNICSYVEDDVVMARYFLCVFVEASKIIASTWGKPLGPYMDWELLFHLE